jgi:hypothetical protein
VSARPFVFCAARASVSARNPRRPTFHETIVERRDAAFERRGYARASSGVDIARLNASRAPR